MKVFTSLDDVVKYTEKGPGNLGCGSFASVNLITHRSDPKQLYAMKEVEKKNPRATELIYKEIKLHTTLNHPHIIRFIDHIETPKKVHIILEYAKHGDMFGFINRRKLSEDECLRLFYQTCEGIRYIHSKNIMHRDLKPENILIDEKLNVKICDFGWSAEYLPNETRQTLCGTYEYMAPEIFHRKQQTKKTDIWALGILLYELFHGHAPYRGNKMEEVLANIMKNSIAFKKNVDPIVRSLILKILNFEPVNRPTIEEIIESELIANYLKRNPDHVVKFIDKQLSLTSEFSDLQEGKQSECATPEADSKLSKPTPMAAHLLKKLSGDSQTSSASKVESNRQSSSQKPKHAEESTKFGSDAKPDRPRILKPLLDSANKKELLKPIKGSLFKGDSNEESKKHTPGDLSKPQSFTTYLNAKS